MSARRVSIVRELVERRERDYFSLFSRADVKQKTLARRRFFFFHLFFSGHVYYFSPRAPCSRVDKYLVRGACLYAGQKGQRSVL